jgi:uncharacterized damage-inducible protein DinB
MKEILLQFARYHAWANKRMIEAMLNLDDETLDQEVASSFNSLRATVYHLWSAEFVWLQRLQLTEQPVWVEQVFKGTFQEACQEWQRASETLVQFIEKQYDDKGMEHVFQYYNSQKKSFKNKVGETLLHVFNHGTYHRGQLVTMLRQVGVAKIPNTDFIAFIR